MILKNLVNINDLLNIHDLHGMMKGVNQVMCFGISSVLQLLIWLTEGESWKIWNYLAPYASCAAPSVISVATAFVLLQARHCWLQEIFLSP